MATTRSAGALFVTIGYPSIVLVGPAGVLVPCKQRGGDYGPTMVLSETRGLLLYRVVRRGIRSFVRLKA
jgi:hypothetical protein